MMHILILKIKLSVILPAKIGLFKSNRELQSEICTLWHNHRQVLKTKETTLFHGGDEGVGKASISKESVGINWETEVRLASHWLNCDLLSLTGLLPTQEEIFFLFFPFAGGNLFLFFPFE